MGLVFVLYLTNGPQNLVPGLASSSPPMNLLEMLPPHPPYGIRDSRDGAEQTIGVLTGSR